MHFMKEFTATQDKGTTEAALLTLSEGAQARSARPGGNTGGMAAIGEQAGTHLKEKGTTCHLACC